MIRILQIWCYIFLTTYLTGTGAVNLLRRFACGVRRGNPAPLLSPGAASMAGLVFTTVYAQAWSLLGAVGAAANLGLMALCVLSGIACFPQIAETFIGFRVGPDWRSPSPEKESSAAGADILRFLRMCGIAVLVLFYAYGTSRGYMHTDTILYHAQSIRWAEEAGAVPGLALLHNRLGYNSAAFPLTALFSFPYVFGQSYHCVGGYLALLVMLECMRVLRLFPSLVLKGRERGDSPGISVFVRIAGIYYLLTIYDEMISPASDYFMVCIGFYIVIRFLGLLEKSEKDPFPYALLSMAAVWNITMKLSAAPFILLAVFPVCLYVRRKTARPIIVFVLCAILIALPFLARNVILTGYLLYPYPAIDLFDLPWKIDAGYARSDQMEIAVWGRGYTDVYQYHAPLSYWVPGWFMSQSPLHRILLILDAAAVPGIAAFAGKRAARRSIEGSGLAVVCASTVGGLIFWFASAPLMRYGCVYVYLTAVLFAALLWEHLAGRLSGRKARVFARVFALFMLAFFLWKGVSFGRELVGMWRQDGATYLTEQKDYPDVSCTPYEIDGITFYHADGKGTSYEAFPSSPFPARIRLRRTGLEGGFVPENGGQN